MQKSLNFILLSVLVLFILGCAENKVSLLRDNSQLDADSDVSKENQDKYLGYGKHNSAYEVLAKNVRDESKKHLGKTYRLGADPQETVYADCSNLVCAITRISLSKSNFEFSPFYMPSIEIYQHSYKISNSEVKPGDIVFFNKSQGRRGLYHIGMVTKIKEDGIYFVHASQKNGVIEISTTSRSWNSYWSGRFHSFRRWNPGVFAKSWGGQKQQTTFGPMASTP